MNSNLRASIDIGSNSILLLAADISGDFKLLANESNVTALGKDLDKNGAFCLESMQSSMQILKKYQKICKELGISSENIIATATEAARVASNAQAFFDEVYKETNIKVQLISGEGEAYYSTRGILFNSNFKQDDIFILDIGGASTEIIKANSKTGKIHKSFSMPLGAVRVTNWLEDGVYHAKVEEILSAFSNDLSAVRTAHLQCVAGTMTSVANMHLGHSEFVENEVHGYNFLCEDVLQMLEQYIKCTPDEILSRFPFLGKRSKTIIGGLYVAKNVFEWLNVKEVTISTYGLRYGTLSAGTIDEKYKIQSN